MALHHRSRFILSRCAITLIAAAVAGGCRTANPAVQRSQQAASVLVSARQSLAGSEQSVADAQVALRTLAQSKGDLQPPFAVFVERLQAVRKQAERQQAEGQGVLMQTTAYGAARQEDVRTISNAELRRAAELRTGQMQAQTQTIKESYAKMNAAFAAYLRNLSDLQTYLGNDLNYGALNGAQRWVDESSASGERLRECIRTLAVQVDTMSSSLSPVPIATRQWPTTLRSTTVPSTRP